MSMSSSKPQATSVDKDDLEVRVKEMYRAVALEPDSDFHFEMGRSMAERLGYLPSDLDQIPQESIKQVMPTIRMTNVNV